MKVLNIIIHYKVYHPLKGDQECYESFYEKIHRPSRIIPLISEALACVPIASVISGDLSKTKRVFFLDCVNHRKIDVCAIWAQAFRLWGMSYCKKTWYSKPPYHGLLLITNKAVNKRSDCIQLLLIEFFQIIHQCLNLFRVFIVSVEEITG